MTTPIRQSIISFKDEQGNLAVIEKIPQMSEGFKRLYFINAVPKNVVRGGHSHKSLHQFFIAVAGSFELHLDDGKGRKYKFRLNNPNEGIYVPPGFWRDLLNFSSDAICLVLASHTYDENDYIRNYEEFVIWANAI